MSAKGYTRRGSIVVPEPASLWKSTAFDAHPGTPLRGWRRAMCEKVEDGDTLHGRLEMGIDVERVTRFRVLKVDCSEMSSKDPGERVHAQLAHDFTAGKCLGKPIMVDLHSEQQNNGRMLADVFYLERGDWKDLRLAIIAANLTKADYLASFTTRIRRR